MSHVVAILLVFDFLAYDEAGQDFVIGSSECKSFTDAVDFIHTDGVGFGIDHTVLWVIGIPAGNHCVAFDANNATCRFGQLISSIGGIVVVRGNHPLAVAGLFD